MLAEVFMLRLEAILRANAPTPPSDTRFVPIKLTVAPVKDARQQADK